MDTFMRATNIERNSRVLRSHARAAREAQSLVRNSVAAGVSVEEGGNMPDVNRAHPGATLSNLNYNRPSCSRGPPTSTSSREASTASSLNETVVAYRPTLKILQLNMRGARTVNDELRVCMDERSADVALVQEPYCLEGNLPGLGLATRVVLSERNGEGFQRGLAAIVVRNSDLTVVRIEHLCDSHCVCAYVTGAFGDLYVVSMYCQFGDPDFARYLARLARILQELKGTRVVIAADVNARSPMWGGSCHDERGEMLELFCASYNLTVLNEPGNPSTFSSGRGESNIDVTLVTENVISSVESWKVLVNETTSDHRVIEIVLGRGGESNSEQVLPLQKGRFLTKKADWEQFQKVLMEIRARTMPSVSYNGAEDVERAAILMENVIIEACETVMKVKRWHAKSVPWWTRGLTYARRQTCRTRAAFQRQRDPIKREVRRAKYLKTRKAYFKAVRKAKLASWRELVSKAGNDEPWGVIYRIITKKYTPTVAMSSIRTTNGPTMRWEDTAETLLNALIPDDSPEDDTPEQHAIRYADARTHNVADSPEFSQVELSKAVDGLKNGKCPGLDRIEVEVVKRSYGCLGSDLLKLCNACLKYGVFPARWKVGSIVTLLKGPEKDACDPKSYRPICLLSVLGKVLEKLILVRLTPTLLDPRFCSEVQYGFRSGKSTEDALIRFRELVRDRPEKYVMALSFDISGAFDNVWWPSVKKCLRDRGCPSNLYGLMVDYFAKRVVKIVSKHGVVEKEVTKGCPQGSILGPSCWNLVFDGLLRRLSDDNVECEPTAYADDILVVIYGSSRVELQEKGQKVADLVINWCNGEKLRLSAAKSEMMLVKGKLSLSRPPVIKLYGVNLKLKTTMKYLGVNFDAGLGIRTHVERVSGKVRGLFNRLAAVAKARWGLGFRALRILYRGLLVPIVTYAAAGWADLLNVRTRRELLSAQRQVLLRVTKSYRTVSTAAIAVIAGEIPIDLAITERACLYKYRKNVDFTLGELTYSQGVVSVNGAEVTIRAALRKEVMNRWQERWQNADKGRTTFEYFEDVRMRAQSPWIVVDHYVNQFLSGHGDFRSKLFKFALAEDDGCRCGAVETPQHLLFECPIYDHQRGVLKRESELAGLEWPVAISDLVSKKLFRSFSRFARDVLRLKESGRQDHGTLAERLER